MIICLGIETGGDRLGVAVVCTDADGQAPRTLAQESHAGRHGQAERLFAMIAAVLARAGLDRREITLLAVTIGPGSFTGIRLGLAAAQGLALGLGCPAVGVSRFETVAACRVAAGAAEAGDGDFLVALVGGATGVFVQRFDAQAQAVAEPETVEGLAAYLSSSPPFKVVSDCDHPLLPGVERLAPDAEGVALAGVRYWLAGVAKPALPWYLRPPSTTPPGPRGAGLSWGRVLRT